MQLQLVRNDLCLVLPWDGNLCDLYVIVWVGSWLIHRRPRDRRGFVVASGPEKQIVLTPHVSAACGARVVGMDLGPFAHQASKAKQSEQANPAIIMMLIAIDAIGNDRC